MFITSFLSVDCIGGGETGRACVSSSSAFVEAGGEDLHNRRPVASASSSGQHAIQANTMDGRSEAYAMMIMNQTLGIGSMNGALTSRFNRTGLFLASTSISTGCQDSYQGVLLLLLANYFFLNEPLRPEARWSWLAPGLSSGSIYICLYQISRKSPFHALSLPSAQHEKEISFADIQSQERARWS